MSSVSSQDKYSKGISLGECPFCVYQEYHYAKVQGFVPGPLHFFTFALNMLRLTIFQMEWNRGNNNISLKYQDILQH